MMTKGQCESLIRASISNILDRHVREGGARPCSIDVEMIDVTTMLDKEKVSALGQVFLEWHDDPKYKAGA